MSTNLQKIVFLALYMVMLETSLLGQSPEVKDQIFAAVQVRGRNFLYPGENDVDIILDNGLLDSCVISIEGAATINQIQREHFVINVEAPHLFDPESFNPEVWLSIKYYTGKVLYRQKFFILDIPAPIPLIDGKYNGGDMPLKEFLKIKSIVAQSRYINPIPCFTCKIRSFKVIRIGANGEFNFIENLNDIFNSNTLSLIRDANVGDRYIFIDIISECLNSISVEKESNVISIYITEK